MEANPNLGNQQRVPLCIIESLRAGIASKSVSKYFSQSREDTLARVEDDLTQMAEDGVPQGLVISASYGQGKTHLLNQISELAHTQNYAVSSLVVSKESQVHNLKRFYHKVASSIMLPGETESGLERRLAKLRPSSDSVQDLLIQADNHLHPKLNYVLRGYFSSTDPYDQFLLYGDMTGDSLSIVDIREILQRALGSKPRIPKMSNDQFGQYFILLGWLVRLLGHKGLVILFDEAELLGALGFVSRMKAYLHFASLLGLGGPFKMRFCYPVFFFASGFYSDVIVQKREIVNVEKRASGKFEKADAIAIQSVLDFLLNDREELDDLSSKEVENILASIKQLHGLAYGWDAVLDIRRVLEKTEDAPLRTVIRGAIESLDISLLYQENAPQIAVNALDVAIPGEDEEIFANDLDTELVETK
jgi:hypothetical protein